MPDLLYNFLGYNIATGLIGYAVYYQGGTHTQILAACSVMFIAACVTCIGLVFSERQTERINREASRRVKRDLASDLQKFRESQ